MTAMRLTDFPPPARRYSVLEYQLFTMLPTKGDGITSAELAKRRAKLGDWGVANPLNVVTTTMNVLIDKVKDNREPFKIVKDGKRPGHHMVTYKLERRGRK